MAVPMEKSGVFPPMVVQMVMVGEEVGELAKMLRRISDFYDERLDTYVTRLTALFEPAVLILMGGVVGVIVVAMFLPIFNLSQVVKG
jgi:type IV pilus assembly protein PilC